MSSHPPIPRSISSAMERRSSGNCAEVSWRRLNKEAAAGRPIDHDDEHASRSGLSTHDGRQVIVFSRPHWHHRKPSQRSMSDTAHRIDAIRNPERGPDTPPAIRDLTGGDPDAYPRDLDDLHARLIRWFEESELARMDEIDLAQRDREYFDGMQWTRDELKLLKERGQPAIVINKVADKVQLLCGMERKARTDPKAFARTPAEEDRADAATQALRYIADDNDFSIVRSEVFSNMLIEGAGGADLGLEDDGQGSCNITITTIPWDRIWYDPHSRSYDFSDARYKGMVIWTDRDALEEMYPGEDVQDVIESSFSSTDYQYNDRPETAFWTDNNRTRIRLVQCDWAERGTWWGAPNTNSGRQAAPQRSKFKDRKGKSCSGLLLQSSYINRENQRYGMVRGLISLQDEINKRRSKALHLLSVRQVIAEQGAVPDVDKARREVAKPDGYIEVMPGLKFEIEQTADLAAGQFQLLQHATAEMQLSGPNAAMSGTDPRELSGRAVSWQCKLVVLLKMSPLRMRLDFGAVVYTKPRGRQLGNTGAVASGSESQMISMRLVG